MGEGLDQADVADRVAAVGHGEDVADVAGLAGREVREDEHGDDLDAQDGEVAGAEQQVPEQAEHADLSDLAQVHAGDAHQREDGHEDLRGLTDRVLGGGGEGGVQGGA